MECLNIDGQMLYNMLINASNKLEENKDYVNSLNVFPVPDGDTGTNMSMTFKAAVLEIKDVKDKSIGEVAKRLSKGALMGARGNSGVILSQIFRGIAKALENKKEANSIEFADSIMEGAKSAYKAVMRPTEGTILTIIKAAGEAAVKSNKQNIEELMAEICSYSETVLNKTPDMLPVLKKAKVVDAGGAGLLIILKGMYEILKDGKESVSIKEDTSDIKEIETKNLDIENIMYGYCTEFFIRSSEVDIDKLRNDLSHHGDSMIVVGEEDIVKVHIHTNDPGLVLSKAIKLGELSKIKIDNMREQHRHIVDENNSDSKNNLKEEKEYGFISVALGEGITNIFKDLNVDFVIHGGQTMNPSTQDILDAINKINAKNIFIFPNNKNIIMAANQAKELTEKNIVVLPTKTIPEGITAITTFNSQLELDKNVINMENAIKNVKTAYVTYAVRDTEIDTGEIKEGDILGILNGEIKEVGNNIYDICDKLIDNMITEESELITVFYGEDCKEEEVENYLNKIEEKYDEIDVQFYNGKQPLYYFIISVE
ncbi:dihydroxyacetone kinase subunit DhaL [Clostridium acetireducens DSM 10703]|jgi:DAK2 domain fusion protein YloV|uniref:Dihydroxyacetone kinase subunit DhaL n=1 Tax=Clostridium acetireducens DSM 10703 TaxID=1121290 RepID=A0A1E8F2B1_9CLOT|nr:DAK2 domain-containing protein [Clostridium acetireducens]OFI07681.1 dihydroxyacetone kinase subunit DhaL [Clostridium acetireducens DSM 10703]